MRVHYHATLADEEALSAMLGLKGASGIAPCAMRCWCVGKERQQDIDNGVLPLTARVAGLVDITCCKKADILLKGDADVWEDCDHLAAAPPNRLQDLEKAVGINYHPDGILFDRALRRSFKPCTSHRYDALHVLLSNGLLGAEIVLFFKEAKRHARVTFVHFREYSELWQWLPMRRYSPRTIFSAHREKASDTYLKAGASELLAVYALLREWALSACRDISAMRPSLKSLLLLLDVVDIVVKAATTRMPTDQVEDVAARLDNASFAYLQAFADAHGRIEMRHKHHELIHLADQLRKDKRLLWCFTAERKHIVVKAVMQHNRSLQGFSKGAVTRLLIAQISSLTEKQAWVSKLHCPTHAFDDLAPGARMSKSMRWMECEVASGNPLFIGPGHMLLILVVACVAVDCQFCILGHECLKVRGGHYSSEWTVQAPICQRFLTPTDVIVIARHWRFSDDRSRLTTLH